VLTSASGYRIGPVLVVLPVALLGAVVLFDLSALLSGLDLVQEVARWILGTGLVVGLLVLTSVLIELTATMSATPEHRARGAVSSGLATMVVLFLFVWWVRYDGTGGDDLAMWLVEVVAFGGGLAAAFFARDLPRHHGHGTIGPASAPPLIGLGEL
jgi:uncharacterized membrane protein